MGKYLTLVIFLTFFDSSSLFSQVGGRIVDAKTKQPLVGANIYTDLGVGVSVADNKGEFMINNGELLRDADTLCFSFVGYCTKRFSVTSLLQKKNVILLQEEPFALGEWAMVGSFFRAVQDFRIGVPGMGLQVAGGYLLLKYSLQ